MNGDFSPSPFGSYIECHIINIRTAGLEKAVNFSNFQSDFLKDETILLSIFSICFHTEFYYLLLNFIKHPIQVLQMHSHVFFFIIFS